MQNRRCPFCRSDSSRTIGTRVDVWAKCLNCRSVFRDITPARFQQIHDEAFQDRTHIDSTRAFVGDKPLRAVWDSLSLPGGSVLEIGPGSAHLLAAARQAGCSVEAVESSAVHRKYITDQWGIDSVYATIDGVPAGRTFDTVVAINVFEHIYDIADFLSAVREVLAPGGTFFLSTPNAVSLEATALGVWWSMCKVHDHVAFPSSAGLAVAARESGLRVGRIWSAGLPFEFPVSALVAGRDRMRAARGVGEPAQTAEPARSPSGPPAPPAPEVGRVGPAAKAALTRFYSVAASLDPAYRVLGSLGRAGCVKARLTRLAGRPPPQPRSRQTRQATFFLMIRAGLPATATFSGTSATTTLPAPTTAPAPIDAPRMVAPQPIQAQRPRVTGLARGCGTPSTMSSWRLPSSMFTFQETAQDCAMLMRSKQVTAAL